MRKKINNILFVVFIPHDEVGGHALSAVQLVNSFCEKGYNTFLMINSKTPSISNIHKNVKIIDDQCKNKFLGYLKRGNQINNIVSNFDIDLIVAVDRLSCYHSSFPSTFNKIPLVPIIPGGGSNTIKYPPLKTKKIIVFSEENKISLTSMWGYESDDIIVRDSRFSFSEEKLGIYNIDVNIKIAYISSLREGKLKAYKHFIDETVFSNQLNKINIDVIGDGCDIKLFEDYANLNNVKNINFIGYKNINLTTLEKYNLIVTQGRGIIESSSLCIPCSICGENGYKGLVTLDNIDKYKATNFTGRSLQNSSNFIEDVNFLKNNGNSYTIKLSEKVRKEYDISYLRDEIIHLSNSVDMIPFNGSIPKVLINNIKVFFKKPLTLNN